MKKNLFLLILLFSFCYYPVFAEERGVVAYDFETEETVNLSWADYLANFKELFDYFEQNYPDNKIDEDFSGDLEKFFPGKNKQEIFNLQRDIRDGLKLYRAVRSFADEIKEKITMPEEPPMILPDDEYYTEPDTDYIEADDAVIIHDFKKIIPYGSSRKERMAYEAKLLREQGIKPQTEGQKFLQMLAKIDIKKLPFYNLIGESPITGKNGAGAWVDDELASARLIAYNATINQKEVKAAVNCRLEPNRAVLDTVDIRFKGDNIESYEVFLPAPVRNVNQNGEQIIGFGGKFAIPVIIRLKDAGKALEATAIMDATVCDMSKCRGVRLQPRLRIEVGDGELSAFASFIEQAFYALPALKSKDITLKSARLGDGGLWLDFALSSVSDNFDVFVKGFAPPVISVKDNDAKVFIKADDIAGKTIDIIATLDFGQALKTSITAENDTLAEVSNGGISLPGVLEFFKYIVKLIMLLLAVIIVQKAICREIDARSENAGIALRAKKFVAWVSFAVYLLLAAAVMILV